MRTIFFAAMMLPLLAGGALAAPGGGGGNPNVGRGVDTAAGPMAYPNAAELWAAQRNNPNASLMMGWTVPHQSQQSG